MEQTGSSHNDSKDFSIEQPTDHRHQPLSVLYRTIRREVATDSPLSDLGTALRDKLGNKLAQEITLKKPGLSIMSLRDLHAVDPTPYRLQKLSEVSRTLTQHMLTEMLSESARVPLVVPLGRLVVSRPTKDNRCYLLFEVSESSILQTERHSLTTLINEFEGEEFEWPDFRPHITVGYTDSLKDRDTQFIKKIQKINSTFMSQMVRLEPVQLAPEYQHQ